jgi:hypothetical protein
VFRGKSRLSGAAGERTVEMDGEAGLNLMKLGIDFKTPAERFNACVEATH